MYSLWLTFAPDVQRDLSGAVSQLAQQAKTPVFEPHMTLIGDLDLPRSEALQLTSSLSPAFQGERAKVLGLDFGKTYFQSVFLTLELSPAASCMRQSVLAQYNKKPAYPPHISLGYGIDAPDAHAALTGQFQAAFVGQVLRFQSLVLMASSEDRPIEDWLSIHQIGLAA